MNFIKNLFSYKDNEYFVSYVYTNKTHEGTGCINIICQGEIKSAEAIKTTTEHIKKRHNHDSVVITNWIKLK